VIDLLAFDRTLQGLATTRSQFRALRALAESAGIDLAKIGYTPELLAQAFGDKLDLAQVGELRWTRSKIVDGAGAARVQGADLYAAGAR